MKILCAADHHWERAKRWDECRRIHDWMYEVALREKIDLFISCGDIYERASVPEERIAVAEWITAMAELGPVLVVKGNHDTERDLEILGKLQANHPIVVEERAAVHYFCHSELAVAAVAWPERARILAYARQSSLVLDPQHAAQDALQNVLRGLGAQLELHQGPTLAVGHFNVDGAVVSTGQPLIGTAMHVGLSDLALLRTPLVVMGHIHKPQHWEHGETSIVYTGSPYRTSYGETEDKGVVLVKLDERCETDTLWERVVSPCAAMYLVDEAWEDGSFGAGPEAHLPEDVTGADIRFRYAVAPDERDAARAAAAAWKQSRLAQGARDVQVEECVRTSSHARAPEVATAKTLGDKLSAMWAAKGTTPESPRREVLLGMAAQLEADA